MQLPAQTAQRGGLEYKWVVAIVVIFGAFACGVTLPLLHHR